MSAYPERPHSKFPFQRTADGTRIQVVEQDEAAHINSCELVILYCPAGFRQERPEFGWKMPLFQPGPLDLSGLLDALREFEPRGDPSASEYADDADAAIRHISVNVNVEVSSDGG